MTAAQCTTLRAVLLSALVTRLSTPPLPLLVPSQVFDAFAWCASDSLEWRRPEARAFDPTPIDGSDPSRMVFVFRSPCAFLPGETAALHAFGLGLTDEVALAPYAIDDATDELFARHVPPETLLWLAADNLNALYWGLHDWAHFHNHGPFEERAWTELQCDAAALVWLWINRDRIELSGGLWERTRGEVLALCLRRFEAEGKGEAEPRVREVLAADALVALSAAIGPAPGAAADDVAGDSAASPWRDGAPPATETPP